MCLGLIHDHITATLVVTDRNTTTLSVTSQNPRELLVTVIRLLQALMLLMVISSLPNLLTVWYSALYCPSNHSDINTNVIKHFMRANELMLHNISIGYTIA